MKRNKAGLSANQCGHYLTMARRKLGLPTQNTRRRVVFDTVALRMHVPSPITKWAGYILCREFLQDAATRMSREDLVELMEETSGVRLKAKANRGVVVSMPKKPRAFGGDVTAPEFLQTYEWRQLRMLVLKKRGACCECCGATPAHGVRLNVDHIKPRRLHPELALVESNLQVLCEDCNHGKGNWDQTDWRSGQLRDDDYDIALDTLRRMRASE